NALGAAHRTVADFREVEGRDVGGHRAAELVADRDDLPRPLVAQRFMKVGAERGVLVRIDGAGEGDGNALAVVVEVGAGDVGKGAGGGESLLLDVVADLD